MTWEKPEYIEINMSAEIGGYQDDFEEHSRSQPNGLQQTTAEQEKVDH
jgi:hypothetical protein